MARPLRTCRCGYTKEHELVAEEPEYTLWGWILLSMFGITPKPDHVVYRCQMCRQSVGSTRDPKVLARKSAPKRPPAPEAAAPASPPDAPASSPHPEESPRT
ncbi:MAG: hypothetical protein KF894_28640 [Labilithrix sp.]|nr:hypothetical protein [Labilithrix sp.]